MKPQPGEWVKDRAGNKWLVIGCGSKYVNVTDREGGIGRLIPIRDLVLGPSQHVELPRIGQRRPMNREDLDRDFK